MITRLRLIPRWRLVLAMSLPPLAIAGGLACLVAAGRIGSPPPPPTVGALAAQPQLPPPAGLLVDVSGAVQHPGLYRFHRGDRIHDAIEAAGGLTDQADSTRLPDMAGLLRDGQQVRVPFVKSGAGPGGTAKVSLNQATVEQLSLVPGFTPEFAQSVVDYRNAYGPFSSTRQLVSDLGMSKADFALAKPHLAL